VSYNFIWYIEVPFFSVCNVWDQKTWYLPIETEKLSLWKVLYDSRYFLTFKIRARSAELNTQFLLPWACVYCNICLPDHCFSWQLVRKKKIPIHNWWFSQTCVHFFISLKSYCGARLSVTPITRADVHKQDTSGKHSGDKICSHRSKIIFSLRYFNICRYITFTFSYNWQQVKISYLLYPVNAFLWVLILIWLHSIFAVG